MELRSSRVTGVNKTSETTMAAVAAVAKGFYFTRFPMEDIEGIKRELEQQGVAVVTGVVDPAKCEEFKQEYKMWLRNFGHGFPNNINTIIHKYSVAHMSASWEARLLTKPLFAALWGTQKLLSSYDGVAIGKPPETGFGHFHEKKRHSLHLDQGPKRPGLHAYQGALYLETADEDDWCFQVLTKSHLHFEEFFKVFKAGRGFRTLNDEEVNWLLEKGCDHLRVPVPQGGMVLWDSRLVHDGAPPSMDRKNKDRWRFVNFISMTPAIWAEHKDMAEHKLGYDTLRCSKHWSSSGFSLFPNYRKFPGQTIEELPDIAKTDEARQLAGDLWYDFADGESNGPKYIPVRLQ